MPDAVAREPRVGVGRVFHHRDADLARPSRECLRADRQQRPHEHHAFALEHRRHRREPREAGATAQGEQQGLDLVVGMLAEQDRLQAGVARSPRERLVARVARGVLRAFAGRVARGDAAHLQGHVQLRAHLLAVLLERIGRILQTVVDVDACTCPGQRCAAASSSTVESAPPLNATASGRGNCNPASAAAAGFRTRQAVSALVSEKRP